MKKSSWIIRFLNSVPGGKTIADLIFNEDFGALHREFLGFKFTSPLGVGGGIDPEGRYFDLFGHIGAGFDVIGPLTADNAISSIRNFYDCRSECIPFISVTHRPKSIEDEQYIKDYSDCFSLSYDFAPLFVIDLSNPMLEPDLIRDIINVILDIRFTYEEYKPVIIRLGKHLMDDELDSLTDFCRMNNVDALMCCTQKMVKHVYEHTGGRLPIMGYGALKKGSAVSDMLQSGATLVCLENEIQRRGPFYITRLKRQLAYLEYNDTIYSE